MRIQYPNGSIGRISGAFAKTRQSGLPVGEFLVVIGADGEMSGFAVADQIQEVHGFACGQPQETTVVLEDAKTGLGKVAKELATDAAHMRQMVFFDNAGFILPIEAGRANRNWGSPIGLGQTLAVSEGAVSRRFKVSALVNVCCGGGLDISFDRVLVRVSEVIEPEPEPEPDEPEAPEAPAEVEEAPKKKDKRSTASAS